MGSYFIKGGYRENRSPEFYRDSFEDARRYQVEVYKHADKIASGPEISFQESRIVSLCEAMKTCLMVVGGFRQGAT